MVCLFSCSDRAASTNWWPWACQCRTSDQKSTHASPSGKSSVRCSGTTSSTRWSSRGRWRQQSSGRSTTSTPSCTRCPSHTSPSLPPRWYSRTRMATAASVGLSSIRRSLWLSSSSDEYHSPDVSCKFYVYNCNQSSVEGRLLNPLSQIRNWVN